MTDFIAELHTAHRHHTHIAQAIAETLNAIQQNPIARLRIIAANYDNGTATIHDLTAALTNSIDWDDTG